MKIRDKIYEEVYIIYCDFRNGWRVKVMPNGRLMYEKTSGITFSEENIRKAHIDFIKKYVVRKKL